MLLPEPDCRENTEHDEEQQNCKLDQLKRHFGLREGERFQCRNL
jgi:hypothetical protein